MMNSYHDRTKHSYDSVRQNAFYLDWDSQPAVFKSYPKHYKRIKLLDSVKEHRFLYRIVGISAKKSYASGELFLRTNPSAGALYPNELYFQVRGVEGFEDGLYHLEIKSASATLLYPLNKDGIEANLGFKSAIKGFVFLLSACYFRSSWKYRDRAFRYCLLDGGHILGQIEASAYLKDFAVRHCYDFDKEALNSMFGFGNDEFFLAASIVGVPAKIALPNAISMILPYVNPTGYFEQNHVVETAYHDSVILKNKKANNKASKFTFRKDAFEETIFKRRSIREMSKIGISKASFEFIMEVLEESVMSDCDEEIGIYVVLNRVMDMPLGLWYDKHFIKYGDFSKKAGYLCLEQYHLGENSALTIFFTSSSRNYQALYQKAGILGNRAYLAANYLQIGCSGIGAYYDDEVAEFLEVDSEMMILYGICIGN